MIQQVTPVNSAPKTRKPTRSRLKPSAVPAPQSKKGIQWDLLTEREKTILQELLSKLKKHQPFRVLMTPELANAILVALNWNNYRKLNWGTCEYYANEMLSGHWTECTDIIAIQDDKTVLQGGQHRLEGVVRSGKSIYFYIGLFPANTVMTNDSGSPRSLSARTRREPKVIAAARNMNSHFLGSDYKISAQTINGIVKEYGPSLEFVLSQKWLKPGGAHQGAMAFCHGQLSGHKSQQARLEPFIRQVANGVGLAGTDIAYILHEWLRNAGQGTGADRAQAFHRVVCACYAHLHKITDLDSVSKADAKAWFAELNPTKPDCFKSYQKNKPTNA